MILTRATESIKAKKMTKELMFFWMLALPLPMFAQGTQETQGTQGTIKHVIFIVKENRSFDHLFNCFPGTGSCLQTYPQKGTQQPVIPGNATNKDCSDCSGNDCPHLRSDFITSYDKGQMDNFQIDGCAHATDWAISYGNACYASLPSLSECQIPNYWQWAYDYGLGAMFASAMAPTFPSHMIIFSGTTSETGDNPGGLLDGGFPNGGFPGQSATVWNITAFHQGTCGHGSTQNANGNCNLDNTSDSGTATVSGTSISDPTNISFNTKWTNVPIFVKTNSGVNFWNTITNCSSTTQCTLATAPGNGSKVAFAIPDLDCSSASAIVAGSCWVDRTTGICCRQGTNCDLTSTSATTCTLNTDCPSNQSCIKGNRYSSYYPGVDLAGSAGFTGNVGTVNTSGTTVSWDSGNYFRQWANGTAITIGGTNYSISSVSNYDLLTLTTSAGTQSGAAYTVPTSDTGGGFWPGSCKNHPTVSCYCVGGGSASVGCANDPDPACTALSDTCDAQDSTTPHLQQGSRGSVGVEVTTIADLLHTAGVTWGYYSDGDMDRVAMAYYPHIWYNPTFNVNYFPATPNFIDTATACTSDSNCQLASVVWLQAGNTNSSGKVTVTGGTNVTWSSGNNFLTWWPSGTQITIGGSNYTISQVTSPTSLTLQQGAVNGSGQSYSVSLWTNEHPDNTMSDGEAWTNAQVSAVMNNPYLWNNTAIFVTWDDYGGFYDHVAPTVDAQNWRNGFRIPVVCISKYCKTGFQNPTQGTLCGGVQCGPFVFESMLKCVENLFLNGTRLPGSLFDGTTTTPDLCTGSSTGGSGHTNNPGMLDLTLNDPPIENPLQQGASPLSVGAKTHEKAPGSRDITLALPN